MSSHGSKLSVSIPNKSQRESPDSRWQCSPSCFARFGGFPDINLDDYNELYPPYAGPIRRPSSSTGFSPESKRTRQDDGQVELATTEVLTPTPIPVRRHDPLPKPDSDSDYPILTSPYHGPDQRRLGRDSPKLRFQSPKAKKDNFRLNAKNIFCTWPQCILSKEDCMKNIINCSIWKDDIVYAIVCNEDHHETDGKHLHALIMCNNTKNIKAQERLNALTGKHGDYKTARNVKNSVTYIKKDGNYIEHGSCPRKLGEEKVSDKIVKLVKEGKDLRAIDKEVPAAVLLNAPKIKEYIAMHKKWRFEDCLPPKALYVTVDTMHAGAGWDMVFNWSNLNLPMQGRPIRQTQLYLWGETALGKTRLITWIEQFFHVYHMPHSLWMEDFNEDVHQVAICDEFNGCYPITFINEVLIT